MDFCGEGFIKIALNKLSQGQVLLCSRESSLFDILYSASLNKLCDLWWCIGAISSFITLKKSTQAPWWVTECDSSITVIVLINSPDLNISYLPGSDMVMKKSRLSLLSSEALHQQEVTRLLYESDGGWTATSPLPPLKDLHFVSVDLRLLSRLISYQFPRCTASLRVRRRTYARLDVHTQRWESWNHASQTSAVERELSVLLCYDGQF